MAGGEGAAQGSHRGLVVPWSSARFHALSGPGTPSHFTLPLAVAMFQSQYSTDTARVFAYTALSMLPALSIFVFAQRYLVGGLVGAIRG